MAADDSALMTLIRDIVAGDGSAVSRSLTASPALASSFLQRQGATRQSAREYFFEEIAHYLYAGDTPLHAAAAAHRPATVHRLVGMGADVRARNRRGAQPLQAGADGGVWRSSTGGGSWTPIADGLPSLSSGDLELNAADGSPGSANWDPGAQQDTVVALLAAGADPNGVDKGGVTPLHRAARNRCAAAVRALLEGGADPRRPNGSGSTPMQLAHWTTGRGGSGSPAAKAEQKEIVRLLIEHGAG